MIVLSCPICGNWIHVKSSEKEVKCPKCNVITNLQKDEKIDYEIHELKDNLNSVLNNIKIKLKTY